MYRYILLFRDMRGYNCKVGVHLSIYLSIYVVNIGQSLRLSTSICITQPYVIVGGLFRVLIIAPIFLVCHYIN